MSRAIRLACFAAAGIVMASAGITIRNWQLYAVLVLMEIACFAFQSTHGRKS